MCLYSNGHVTWNQTSSFEALRIAVVATWMKIFCRMYNFPFITQINLKSFSSRIAVALFVYSLGYLFRMAKDPCANVLLNCRFQKYRTNSCKSLLYPPAQQRILGRKKTAELNILVPLISDTVFCTFCVFPCFPNYSLIQLIQTNDHVMVKSQIKFKSV